MQLGKLLGLGLFVSAWATGMARADESIWGDWQATGNGCRKETLEVLPFGDSVAVLFTEMGVHFPQGARGDGKHVIKRCAFRVQVTPPAGMYMESLRQTYAGGIIKSKKAAAQILVRYRLGSIRNAERMAVWKKDVEISPADAASVWTEEFNDTARNPICREKVALTVDLNFMAMRESEKQFIIGNVDSLDAAITPELSIRPTFKPCKRR